MIQFAKPGGSVMSINSNNPDATNSEGQQSFYQLETGAPAKGGHHLGASHFVTSWLGIV